MRTVHPWLSELPLSKSYEFHYNFTRWWSSHVAATHCSLLLMTYDEAIATDRNAQLVCNGLMVSFFQWFQLSFHLSQNPPEQTERGSDNQGWTVTVHINMHMKCSTIVCLTSAILFCITSLKMRILVDQLIGAWFKVSAETNVGYLNVVCRSGYYPVRICAAGLCIWSRRFVYLCVLYYLILEFKCFQSGFLRPASCTDRAIHTCSI